jgi:membrane protease subunit (stomatin/prohibitin family)
MGIWDKVKPHLGAQFLDVIEWTSDDPDIVAWRFPIFNKAIQDGAQLVVREGQTAIFVQEGKLSEVFGPGTYELSTNTQAIMSFFESIAYQLNYPYKGDVIFVKTTEFPGQRWGTKSPLRYAAPGFNPVTGLSVRAYGHYDFRVTQAGAFLRALVGTAGEYGADSINEALRAKLVSSFRDMLNEEKPALVELDGMYDELGQAMLEKHAPRFEERFGVRVVDFVVEAVTVPESVEQMHQEDMGLAGISDVNKLTQYEAAKALRASAENTGGGGNQMMDAGIGLAMGQMVAGQMANSQQAPATATPPPAPSEKTLHYNGVGGAGQYTAGQIAELVKQNPTGAHNVWDAGWPEWKSWSDVPAVAGLVPPPPPAATPPPPPPIDSE